MIFLSQRDLRWASDKLGASKLTVGRYGCTTTCVSMLSDYFKCYMSPKEMAAHKDWYTKGTNGGLIIWQNLVFAHMGFIRREYGEHMSEIVKAIENPSLAVTLQVNDGQHWVAALRLPNLVERLAHKGDVLVLDPWTGAKVWAKQKYKNITGAAYFGKK